jgi:homoserine trans-succinylase
MLKTHIKELDEKAELLKENNINIKKTINDLTQDVSLGETRISVINLLNKNISKNDNLLSVMANERKEIGIKIKLEDGNEIIMCSALV